MDQKIQSEGQTQNSPKKKWYTRWWVIVIALIIVVSVIGSIGEDSTPSTAENSDTSAEAPATGTKEPENKSPEVTVTSAALAKAYKDNEVAADQKYKDKVIEVSGKVTGVDNGILDNEIIVKLSDGEYDFSGPWCYMLPSEHDKVVSYAKGQQVTLIGIGNSATIGSPILKECVVKE